MTKLASIAADVVRHHNYAAMAAPVWSLAIVPAACAMVRYAKRRVAVTVSCVAQKAAMMATRATAMAVMMAWAVAAAQPVAAMA
jgi:hypothetical protein